MIGQLPVPPRVHATRLSKHYGATVALGDVSLKIFDGEAAAIMGPSGSGKTTLLHVLAGIIRPDHGEVLLRTAPDTVDLAALDDAARSALRLSEFGFVFQQGLLIPELTALENVALPLLLTGVTRRSAEIRGQEALDQLGLEGMGARRPGQLSGGQAQRVAIARATVTGANTVFADEPTGALDSHTAQDVMDALVDVASASAGRSLVVVTHDEAVAARCSRILRLLDGRIVSDERKS
ncbi:ABC transporter ATP-binding protein [Nocardiopsis dassonvillei]|uniref:ABC transporter ATP-binding protein n=1 Tax=Nocardiopsis dassonvillei TaxID=2014 RepID=UPI003628024A